MVMRHAAAPAARRRSGNQGFTYLWVLVAIAIMGLGLTAVSEVWVTSARRQQAVQLDWAGAQFSKAIGSYYQSTPGAAKVYPTNLEELLEDRRYLTVRRHLRAIYANPFTGSDQWDLVTTSDGRIQGVRALIPSDDGATAREYVYLPDLGAVRR